jgi:hypothetical protein
VRFADGIGLLLDDPNCVLLEVGPGQTLTKLAKQNLNGNARTRQAFILNSLSSGHEQHTDLEVMLGSLGKLWLAGVEIDWTSFSSNERRMRLPLPTYPFERQRYWIETKIHTGDSNRVPVNGAAYAAKDVAQNDVTNIVSEQHSRPATWISYRAPESETERRIVEVWQEIFGIGQIGIDDNFWELGGDTLVAAQTCARLCNVLRIDIPVRCLFEHPTVARLAPELEKLQAAQTARQEREIKRIPRNGRLPLSFAQQRMWLMDQLEPNSAFYNLPAAVRIQGNLDVAALEESFNEIVRRHEVLRTTFGHVEGHPIQILSPAHNLTVERIDLRHLPEEERLESVEQLAAHQARLPFDLTQGPLLRVKLLKLKEQEHIVLLTLHHIVSDGWSVGVMVRELKTLYNAFTGSRPSPLSDLPIQYADFAHWQREWLEGGEQQKQLAYWKKQLSGNLPVLHLPGIGPRPMAQTFRGARYHFQLPLSLTEELKHLSRCQEVTLFMTLLAAFQTLLHRYTGEGDILIGSPIANRTCHETEALIGFFANTLVLRADLSDNPTFRRLLGQVRETTLSAYAHQDLPFDHLVEELQPERSLSYTPLFQVMFILQTAPVEEMQLPGLTIDFLQTDSGTAKFDLNLDMVETEYGLGGSIEYSTDLFDEGRIAQLLNRFQTLLESIVADPDQEVSKLQLVSAHETREFCEDFVDDLELELSF